jgi:8-oxo-dGTP diphosphatase
MYKFCPKCGYSLIEKKSESGDTKREVCLNCGFIHYPQSKPCVGVFVLEEGRVLLVRRSVEPFKEYWDIPGGFLEEGEHPEQGAVREIKEETGLIVEPTKILGIFMDKYGPDQEATLNICYIAKKIDGELKAGSDAKEAKWFNLKKLPRKIAFEWSKDAIKQLQLMMK